MWRGGGNLVQILNMPKEEDIFIQKFLTQSEKQKILKVHTLNCQPQARLWTS